jgi:DNA-binding LacI/PurR family transcriptional regulator
VRVDTVDAVRQSVADLLAQGRQRIGMELWNLPDELMNLPREGYFAELAAQGHRVDEQLVYPSSESWCAEIR